MHLLKSWRVGFYVANKNPAWPDAIKKQIFVGHLHGQIKIAIYSCHIKIARVDGA